MQPHERLKEARIESGFRTGTEAANAMGITVATYNAHENGHRGLTVRSADRYAKFFSVRPSWLLTGEEPKRYQPVDDIVMQEIEDDNDRWGRYYPGKKYINRAAGVVPEIDAYNTEPQSDESYGVVASWGLPPDFVNNVLKAGSNDIYVLGAPDDAMSPTIKAADRVIVDGAVRAYRGDGFYVLKDRDHQLHIRRITKLVVPGEKGEDIALSTDQPPAAMLVWFTDINIVGKVIGQITPL